MKIQCNKTDIVDLDNIEKIVQTKRNTRIYLKSGYPKIIISKWKKDYIMLQLVNNRVSMDDITRLL